MNGIEASLNHPVSPVCLLLRMVASGLLAALLAWALPARAADGYIPTPYVPSTTIAVDEMLRVADVRPDDLVVDLGSGDGRIVIAAARDFGARGLGIEIDPDLVRQSTENAQRAGVADRVVFREGDVLKADFGAATVVTMYLLPQLVEMVKPRVLSLKPGTRVIAHDFGFQDWGPDRTVNISKNYYLYVVPARVAGKWRLSVELPGGPRTYDFELEQNYQRVRGGARVPGGWLPAFEARLSGDAISFVLVDSDLSQHFEGRINGAEMSGVVRSGTGRERATGRWRATRVLAVPDEG